MASTYQMLSNPKQCLDVDAKKMPSGKHTKAICHCLGCPDQFDRLPVIADQPHNLETYHCNTAFKGGENQKFALDQATGQLDSSLYSSMTSCVAVCDSTADGAGAGGCERGASLGEGGAAPVSAAACSGEQQCRQCKA